MAATSDLSVFLLVVQRAYLAGCYTASLGRVPTCVLILLLIPKPAVSHRLAKVINNYMAGCLQPSITTQHSNTLCTFKKKQARVLILFFRETKGNSFDISSCSSVRQQKRKNERVNFLQVVVVVELRAAQKSSTPPFVQFRSDICQGGQAG